MRLVCRPVGGLLIPQRVDLFTVLQLVKRKTPLQPVAIDSIALVKGAFNAHQKCPLLSQVLLPPLAPPVYQK